MSGKNEHITNLIKICNLGISRCHTLLAKRYILRVHPANEFRNNIKLICQHNVTKTYYRNVLSMKIYFSNPYRKL